MLVSSKPLHQTNTIDPFTLHIRRSGPYPSQFPPITLDYHISSNQRLSITLTNDTQTTYLQTLAQVQIIHSVEVPLNIPFDWKILLQRVPYRDLPTFLHEKFTVRLYKGTYTLFPLLKGGGGALTTCAGPKQKRTKLSPYIDTDHDEGQSLKSEIEKKKDIKLFYLPERDGYPKKDDLVTVGPFYEELVDNVFKKIEKENRDKLRLGVKNFRKYIVAEIQGEESKLLRAKFEESIKANKSIGEIFLSMITLLRRDLYKETPGKENSEDALFEPLFPYEEKIMIRMIISILLKSANPYTNETEEFEVKVANKILKYAKKMLKIRHNEKKHQFLSEVPMFNPRSNPAQIPGILDTGINLAHKYKRLLSLPYEEAIKQAQLYVLRGLSWNKYSASLLVKHYNAITDSKEHVDERNRTIIVGIINNMLNSYQEKEDTLTPGEINELVGLGGIQHHPKDSKERTLFQRLLSQFASDINNDLVFDSLKTQALAAIIFQHSNDGEESSRVDDDLKQCMDVLHRQVERRLFTAENQNMQDCMDALNLVLYTMANRGVKGLREQKEMAQLAATFKDQLPGLAKNAFSLVFGNKNDPSLRIKAKYAQEALKRIGTADADLNNVEAAILEAAPAVIGIVSGIFTFNADAVISGLKTLAVQGLDLYASLEKGWYDEVNKVYFLANMEFEEFEKRYFNPASKVSITGEDFVYFISRELYKVARTTSRTYTDRRKSIEWLGSIHEGETIKGERLNHFNFIGKQDIKAYLHKCLSDLARMPQEDNISFDAGLAEVAKRTLGRLGLEPIKQETSFEFVSHKAPDSNSLLLSTLKSSMTLEYAFSIMYTNCRAYYEKEIKHLDYIEIEGEKYVNKVKLDKREPLWSSSTSHALDTFLTSPEYPVLLIQGDAGTGKSTFLKIIEYQQWKSYKQGHSNYIPIFIRLSEILNPAKCLTEAFQTLHFSHRVLEQLKEEGSQRSYLFIFDGYDELKAPKNLYEINKLFDYGKNAKVIVTSREEYLKGYGNYIKYFRPRTGEDLLEYRITPLAERQREIYLNRKAIQNQKTYEHTSDKALKAQLKDWMSVDNYIDAIKRIPGLEDLIKTPYMLTIITSILPSLESDAKSRVTKANIYKVFTMKGFEVEMNRILENSKEDLPKGLDLEKSFYEFAKDLAINLYLTDRTSIKTEGSNYVMDYTKTQPQKQEVVQEPTTNTDEAQRFARFFSDDPKVKLARSGVPITMMDGQVRFNHKSIMEYFAARCFYDELKFCTIDVLHKRSLSWKLLKGGNQINQESDVLNFLKEMVEDNDYKQTHLNEQIRTDAEKPQKSIGQPQPVSAISSPTTKLQVSSPLSSSKLYAKVTASWKPSPSKIPQDSTSVQKESQIALQPKDSSPQKINKENDEQSGVHVVKKLKEAIKLRGRNEITNNFYLNVMMIVSVSWPEVMDVLEVQEMKKLEQIPNTQTDFKEVINLALSKYYHTYREPKLYHFYANQYLSYRLKGNYKGEIAKDPTGWVIYANGQGEISYDNEDFYTGSWVSNKKHGYGVYTFDNSDRFRVYDGHWEDDTFHGEGKMVFVDNCVYYGHWKQGVQDGWGEFIQYTTQNKTVEVLGVYKGYWSQGQKHGTGTIYFERHSYHGTWNHGAAVKGQIEFTNGAKVSGIYSEEYGFKPDTSVGEIQFNHEYSIKVANTKIFVRQRVNQFNSKRQGKKSSAPEFGKALLVQDDDGNSPVLLYCKRVKSRTLNEMMPHFLGLVASMEPLHANKRSENLIHMLICNKSISVGYKNNLLDKLKESYPKFYSDSILPIGREFAKKESAEIPLVYALERLGMLKIKRKNADPVLLKLELMKKLTPQGNANNYISGEINRAKIDSLTLALLEFDSDNHQDLYIGPASSIEAISDQIRRLSDNVLAELVMRGEKELLLKLIEQKFFYLYGKNLRYILLSNLEITTEAKEKKTLEQLFSDKYKDILDAPVFKITESLIDGLPPSAINTTFKEKKKIMLEEHSKFIKDLTLDYFRKHMPIPASAETYTEFLTRPLLKKVLGEIDVWKVLCSWLSAQFRYVEKGEDSLHSIVQSLLKLYGKALGDEKLFYLLIWLATPQENGIYRSPEYCYKIFTDNFIVAKFSLDKTRVLFYTYRWLEDYLRFAKSLGKKNSSKVKPEEFRLEELADLLLDDKRNLFKPLVSQSLVVAAIELKDPKLALKLIEKCGQWIQKLHKWETVWLHNGKFLETPDSEKSCFKSGKKKEEPYFVVVRNKEAPLEAGEASVEVKVSEELTELSEACQERCYKDQLYFVDSDISNIMLVSEKAPEDPAIEVPNSVGIIEVQQKETAASLNRESGTQLINCITHESMAEVLRVLTSKSIYVTGLRQYVRSRSDRFIMSLFSKSDYLLHEQDYVHRCLTFQNVYDDIEAFNYRQVMKDYIVKQYLDAFHNKIPPSNVLGQHEIAKIVKMLLRSTTVNYRFFASIIDMLIIKMPSTRAIVEKSVLFLQEVVLSLQSHLVSADYMQLCCDVYMKIESKLIGHNNVADMITEEESQYDKKNLTKGLKLIRAQIQSLETELKAQTIPTTEAEAKINIYNEKNKLCSEKKTQCEKDLTDAVKYLEAAQEEVRKISRNSIVEMKSFARPPDMVLKMIVPLTILFDIPEANWGKGKQLLADPNFLNNMKSFNFDSLPPEKIQKVEKGLEEINKERIAMVSLGAASIFGWMTNGITFAKQRQTMFANENTPEKLAELEKEFLAAKADLYEDKQRQYRFHVLTDQINNLKETGRSLKQDFDSKYEDEDVNDQDSSPSSNETDEETNEKVKVPEKTDSLLKFFIEVVWKNLPSPSSRKTTKFVFEWVNRWLQGKYYHSIKTLIESVCSGKLNFENTTPFTALIYQRLLALAIEKGSQELALALLTKFKEKLHRIKSWTILRNRSSAKLTIEASEALGDKEKEDKLKDLKSRDKQLKYFNLDSKIVVLVPSTSDIGQKTSITQETEDVVMIIEDDNDFVLHKLAQDNMRDILKQIGELGAYVGDLENIINRDLPVADSKRPKKIDFGFLYKLRALNYPLSKGAQTKLMSPDEWDCKNYKDYLLLLLDNPDSRTDPIRWLLKKTNVLEKVMLSVDTEQKAKDFLNNFVSKYTKDSIKSAEDILLAKVIKKRLGIIFVAYLELINAHPNTQNRFSHVYKECILKDLDSETAQDLLLHIQEYPESCTELDLFVSATLQKVEGYADLHYNQLVKQLLKGYLTGTKTAEQTIRWIKLIFSNSAVFVGASCSDSEFAETLIYNLLKSRIYTPTLKQEDMDLNSQVIKERLGQVSCLMDTVMECLGYKVIGPANGYFKIARVSSRPLLTQAQLSIFYKELLELIEVKAIELPSTSTWKGYDEFAQKIGINLPPALDIISYSVLNIQVVMHLQLIEELELGSMENPHIDTIGYNTLIKFVESTLEPPAPIQYSTNDSEKSVSISYYFDAFQKLPSANLLRTNTDNFCQVKSALFPESVLQLYDPLLLSIQYLHQSLSSDSTDENLLVSLQQSLPHFTLFSQQSNRTITLCEQMIYSSLYCLCLQANSADQSGLEEKLDKAFQKAKVGTISLLDQVLTILGIEIQFSPQNVINVKQTSKSLCSVNDLRRLESYFAELLLSSIERVSKVAEHKAEECVGFHNMKELGLGLPEDLNAFNFCVLSVTLAIKISTLFGSMSLEGENAMAQGQKEFAFRLVPVADKFPQVSYLLSSSETEAPLYYKIRKLENVHVAYIFDIIPFSDIEREQLSISGSKVPSQTSEYVTFSRNFLVGYCGKQQYTTSNQYIPALLKNMIYSHECLASAKPEQLDKIRLLEHIMGIFLTVFDIIDLLEKSGNDSLDKLTIAKLHQFYIKDRDIAPLSFLNMIIKALGYELELENSLQTMSLKRVSQPICHMRELLSVRSFLIDTKRTIKIRGPQAKTCSGYELFESTTGLKLPEECDAFSLYILLIDLVQCLTLTEDLTSQDYTIYEETDTAMKCVYKLRLVLQLEEQLKPMNIKEEENAKIVNVYYRIRSTKEWPEGYALEINESNYDELRRPTNEKQIKKEKGKEAMVRKPPKLRSVFLQGWKPSEKLKEAIEFEND